MTGPRRPPRGQHGLGDGDYPLRRRENERYMAWVTMKRLLCPSGHSIRQDSFVFTDGAVRCKWKDPASRLECGRWLYLVACVPAREPTAAPSLFFAVETTHAELCDIQGRGLGPLEVLELLGAANPRSNPKESDYARP